MKNVYQIQSDRGGYHHNFVKYDDNHYVFLPDEDWMLIYINGDGTDNICVDSEGGPFITEGWYNDEITVEKIFQEQDRILFLLKENSEK